MNYEAGVDVAFSLLTPQQVRWLWDNGFRHVSHCLWTGGYSPKGADGLLIAPRNIRTVHDTEPRITQDGYIVVDDRKGSGAVSGAWHVDHGYGAVADLWPLLDPIWVDVEQEDPQFGSTSFPTVRAAVERTHQLGKGRDIYTSRYKWAQFGDSHDFGDCRFWLASYDGNPDPAVHFAPFPSCSAANYVGKQWHNTTDAGGVSVDLDSYYTDKLYPAAPAPPLEDYGMLKLIKLATSNFTYMTNGIHRVYVQNPTVLKEYQDAGICGTDVAVVSEEALKAIVRLS